ncbi:hypothetical protein ACLB2K_073929 [Fragaria x ananassa]
MATYRALLSLKSSLDDPDSRLSALRLLNLSNNVFNRTFPPELSNLTNLRVLDLYNNNLTGVLPVSMATFHCALYNFRYMRAKINYVASGFYMSGGFAYSMSIATKGLELYYPRIQEAFAIIDISGNRFEGSIHEIIGNLKGLRSLNISNNIFTGSIPSFMGNLILLESLDVSQNKLSGEIPQQLMQLTFLAKFNVSHNNLTGPIPHGTQLTSFDITSYEGNPGLYGDPLPKKCGSPSLPPSSVEENDSTELIDWKFVVAGFESGLIVGVVYRNCWNDHTK